MNELEAKQKRIWQHVARNWRDEAEQVEAWFAPVTRKIFDSLPIAGGTLADLGCGCGSIPYPKTWKVIGLDIVEDMVEAHGSAALGSFDKLPFKNNAFDAIVSRFGFIFAADVLAAFREARRVLKPNAKIVFSAWGSQENNPAISIPTKIGIEILGLDHPKPTDPGAFRLADENEVRALLSKSGFIDSHLETVKVPYHQSLERHEALRSILSLAGPVSTLYARMKDSQKQDFETAVLHAWSANDLTGEASVWSAQAT